MAAATAYRSSKTLEKGGRSERDKLGRRRSTKSIIPPTLDHYSLSHRSSSAVYSAILSHGSILRQLILGSGLVVQVVSVLFVAVGKISTDTTHRAVPRR